MNAASAVDYLANTIQRGLVRGTRGLPFRRRRAIAGTFCRAAVDTIPSLRKRTDDNLRLVAGHLSDAERREIRRDSAYNFGSTLFEIMDPAPFLGTQGRFHASGAGLTALRASLADGKGALLVTGHFGQWEAIRGALRDEGIAVGGFFRPQNNRWFNEDFYNALAAMGEPIVPKTPQGIRQMIKHIAKGGVMAMLTDQKVLEAERFDFLGHPARTSTAAAEIALRMKVPLIPVYGIRQENPDEVLPIMEAPIVPSDPATMTQEVNNSLAARVLDHPDQWFWLHRRWA